MLLLYQNFYQHPQLNLISVSRILTFPNQMSLSNLFADLNHSGNGYHKWLSFDLFATFNKPLIGYSSTFSVVLSLSLNY